MIFCAATNNSGKLKEFRRILEAMGHEVKSQKELGISADPDETGTTFEENALIKAKAICELCGMPTLADDSGLVVDALNGEPGIYSARYCGIHGDDEANNVKLLANLKGVPEKKRTAKFVAAVVLYLPNGRHISCMGECPGIVGTEPHGSNGFGYDPIFIPDYVGINKESAVLNTEKRSYAELQASEKDAISHRGRALSQLQTLLENFLKADN